MEKPARLLTAADIAAYLSVPLQTIYGWRTTGKGPRAMRVGKHLRYRSTDVERWLDQQADPIPAD